MIEGISTVIIFGIIGTFNFWILRELNLTMFFNSSKTDEKNNFILMLGLINYAVYYIIHDITNHTWNIYLYYIVAPIVAFRIEYLILKYVHDYRDKKENIGDSEKGSSFYIPILKKLLTEERYISKPIFLYVYDFNDTIIDYGYLYYYSTDDNEDFELVIRAIDASLETDFDVFRNGFPYYKDYDKVYINFEKKIKIYLVSTE